MATILIVSGSYFPYATANAVCAKKFEDILKQNGHEVIYCNRKHDLYEEDYHVYDGTELYTVGKNSDLFFQTVDRLHKLDLPNGMGKAFSISYQFYRAWMKLTHLGENKEQQRINARKHYIRAYAEKIKSIVIDRKVDAILSVSMPFDSHMAVLNAVKLLESGQKPKWIAYCIDAYWSKAIVSESDVPRMKQEEKEVFDACDRILFLDTIEKDYAGAEFDVYRAKMTSMPLPLFDLRAAQSYAGGFEKQAGVTEIVFTGTVYDDFSNMNTCVHVTEQFRGKPCRFHFMGKIYPKSLAQLEALQQKMPGQIVIYGRMPYAFAKGSMQKADILLNLANDNTNQIPSKIFEYMMCLKPILNIYSIDEDVGTAYLKKYPLAFHYKNGVTDDAQNGRLMEWVEAAGKQRITMEELDGIFHEVTTAVVAENFCEICTRLMECKSDGYGV